MKTSENTGIKMTTRRSFAGHSSEQTLYLLEDRKRMEFRNHAGRRKPDGSEEWVPGPRLAAITRCDLGRTFELNLDAAAYVSAPYPLKRLIPEVEARGRGTDQFQPRELTLRIEIETVDTGERREFFGRTARHVITTRKQIALQGSRSEPQETVTDGWYIDLDTRLRCERNLFSGKRGHAYLVAGNQPAEKPEFVDIGEPETGFPVQLVSVSTSTQTLRDGSRKERTSKHETLVIGLEVSPLDPRLFEIPPGFKHVRRIERNP